MCMSILLFRFFALFRPFEKLGGTYYSGVFIFLFSKPIQVPQVILGMGRVIYVEAHSVVIRTTLRVFEQIIPVLRKTHLEFFEFWSN